MGGVWTGGIPKEPHIKKRDRPLIYWRQSNKYILLAAKQVFTLLPTTGIISLFAELLFCYRDNYRGGKER